MINSCSIYNLLIQILNIFKECIRDVKIADVKIINIFIQLVS